MPLSFKHLEQEDLPVITPYLLTQTDRFCDWTVGALYMWRQFFSCRYTIAADCLVFQVRQPDGQDYFTYPLGRGDHESALALLEEYCAAANEQLQFTTVSTADAARLTARYGKQMQVLPQRDFYDYLYEREALATFAGRRYSRLRNHIHQFQKRCPHWQYRSLAREDLPAVERFLEEWITRKEADGPLSPLEKADADGTREMLSLMHDFGFSGGLLTDGEAIVAFCVGEQLGDTLYVHIEKGDTHYDGAYQLLVREYAAHSDCSARFINREDDTGNEGLRRSKMAYRPCAILEKNNVIPPKAGAEKG